MIATTLEQSRKLIEIGIDPTTADMHYAFTVIGGNAFQEMIDKAAILLSGRENTRYHYEPAWSLSALLGLMPIIDENTYKLYGTLDGGCICEHPSTSVIFQEGNAIDATFEMVVWLKENKYI